MLTAVALSIGAETLMPLLDLPCDAAALSALCVNPALEPPNFHTTERHPVDATPRSSARYMSINTLSVNSFTTGPRFILGDGPNDVDLEG